MRFIYYIIMLEFFIIACLAAVDIDIKNYASAGPVTYKISYDHPPLKIDSNIIYASHFEGRVNIMLNSKTVLNSNIFDDDVVFESTDHYAPGIILKNNIFKNRIIFYVQSEIEKKNLTESFKCDPEGLAHAEIIME